MAYGSDRIGRKAQKRLVSRLISSRDVGPAGKIDHRKKSSCMKVLGDVYLDAHAASLGIVTDAVIVGAIGRRKPISLLDCGAVHAHASYR